ncbi:MAG TPA: AI-2E family transporter [archaeon]|nr:AI-2E family transporter [archaeon]
MILKSHIKDESIIFRPTFKLTSMAVLILFLVSFLLWIPGLLSSFLIALILVYILSPAVDFFERHGVIRIYAISIVLFLILVLSVAVGMIILQVIMEEYQDLASRLNSYLAMFNEEINLRAAELERRFGMEGYGLGQKLIKLGQEELKTVFSGTTFSTLMTWLAVVPLFLFFFLLDGYKIKKAFIGFLPNRYFEMCLNIDQKIDQIVGSFIRAKFIEAVVTGLVQLMGFYVVGFFYHPLNYAVFLALIVGVLDIIPYIGPIIGSVPVLFVAIVQYVLMPQFPEFSGTGIVVASWAPVLAVCGTILFTHIVDNAYLQPVVLGHSVNVHALVVLISVILGAKLLGITGMIISIPVAGILQTLAREVAYGIRHLRH